MSRLSFSVLVLVGGLVLTACQGQPSAGGPGAASKPPPVPVAVAPVSVKAMPVEVDAIGSVQASSVVAVRSQVTGVLTEVHFNEGSDVRQGQLLFIVDPRPWQEALDQASAQLQKSQASLRQAQATLERDRAQLVYASLETKRYQTLLKQGMVSDDQALQQLTNEQALQATVAADIAAIDTWKADRATNEAAVANARLQLEYCSIRSPIDGRAGQLAITAGNVVSANASVLVTINRIRPIYTTFSIPEAVLPQVTRYAAGGTLTVHATPPGAQAQTTEGVLDLVDNQIDPTTGTIVLRATFPNAAAALWPGQFVNVHLQLTSEPKAITVPSQAVQSGQQGRYVYVVGADDHVAMRPVEVERIAGADAVIASGLHEGETVVVDGQLRLVSGALIQRVPAVGGVAVAAVTR